MVEIHSKCLVRAIGKVLARTSIKAHKCDGKWPLFVNKQLFWWSASITLDNNNDVLTETFTHFSRLILYPHTSVGLISSISTVFSVLNILTRLTTMLHVG